MAASNLLPVPQQLEIHDPQAAEKWKRFKRAWTNYSLAIGLTEKAENVQVATLLTVIGEEAREVFATFSWTERGDEAKINKVLQMFISLASMYPSKGTDSIAGCKSRVSLLTSIVLPC